MRRVLIANDVIAEETKRLIDEGQEVTLRVKGNSMLPFIHGDKDMAVLRSVSKPLSRWDIVLAYDTRGVLVLHRIIKIEDNVLTLMGDGNLKGVEQCKQTDVIAKLEAVQREERRWDCNTRNARLKAVIWFRIRPLRRYLLGVYRRII